MFHYESAHGFPQEQMKGRSVCHEAVLQHVANKSVEITTLEYDALAPAEDENKFNCKLCLKIMSKYSAMRHFVGKHDFSTAVVKDWLVVKDARSISRHRYGRCALTACYQSRADGAGGGDPAGEGDVRAEHIAEGGAESNAMAAQGDELVVSESIAGGSAQGEQACPQLGAIHKLTALVTEALQPKGVEVPMPKVDLSELCATWTHHMLGKDKKRHACPIKCATMDLEDFKQYLVSISLDQSTVKIQLENISRFFKLLDVESGDFTHIGILCAVYQEAVLKAMLASQVLHPSHTWSLKVVSALDHYCSFLLLECGRKRWGEASRCINQLMMESLVPAKKRCAHYRNLASNAKNRADAIRLDALPPRDRMLEGVRAAMLDLLTIAREYKGSTDMSWKARAAANTAMVGIVFVNGFAGRSGEWEAMLAAHVREQLSAGKDFLICTVHKTMKQYGDVGKWLSPGTIAAITDYLTLPRPCDKYFLNAAKATGGKKISIAGCLRRFGAIYFTGFEAPTCNLMRKMFHTEMHKVSRLDECMELLSKVDKHSPKVAKDVYVVRSAASDAELGKLLFKHVMGNPVEWPAGASTTSATSIIERHGRAEEKCNDDEGATSDEDELPYFAGGERFGIMRLIGAIGGSPSAVPLGDAPSAVPLAGAANEPSQEPDCSGSLHVKTENAEVNGCAGAAVDTKIEDRAAHESQFSLSELAAACESGVAKRHITYDRSARKFVKHEEQPNVLTHPPVAALVQTSLAFPSGASASSRSDPPAPLDQPMKRTRTILTTPQKLWAFNGNAEFMGSCKDVAPTSWFAELHERGVAEGVIGQRIPVGTLLSAVRTGVRKMRETGNHGLD